MRIGDGFVVVYSITQRSSFAEVENLHNKLDSLQEGLPVFLCGNKVDLEDEREISTEEGTEIAQKFEWGFMETTARSKEHVETVFTGISRLISEQRNAGNEFVKDERRRSFCILL
eukprot:TRINITY_DN2220_c0_g1_i1.p1 TRINITY_DN2220_c0_g1~~TRINITY_DN2220_c0_g1_i1.p1  ORF type:complete len:115 (-),score=23.28 TRINITY_DN2220_c0_g1_i1:56-400(-)